MCVYPLQSLLSSLPLSMFCIIPPDLGCCSIHILGDSFFLFPITVSYLNMCTVALALVLCMKLLVHFIFRNRMEGCKLAKYSKLQVFGHHNYMFGHPPHKHCRQFRHIGMVSVFMRNTRTPQSLHSNTTVLPLHRTVCTPHMLR